MGTGFDLHGRRRDGTEFPVANQPEPDTGDRRSFRAGVQ